MASDNVPGPAHTLFSPAHAAHLDTPLRRRLYNPDKLAEQYIRPGDRVLDFGCGPGFFTRAFAKRVGDTGRVIAADLQQEMLDILAGRLGPEGLLPRIETHRCKPDSLDLFPDRDGKVDVAFGIFAIHEVPDRAKLFSEISAMLVSGGTFFYTEPIIEVSKREFGDGIALAEKTGLKLTRRRWYFLNRAAVFEKV